MAKLRRPPFGIYVLEASPEDIVYAGRRKGAAPRGQSWRAVDTAAERELLGTIELIELAYRGGAVVRRTAVELAALDAAKLDARDNRWLDDVRIRAFLEVLLGEINALRVAGGLAPRTPAQARAAIKTRISELRAAAAATRRP